MAIIVEPCGNCLINGADTGDRCHWRNRPDTGISRSPRYAVQQTLTQLNQMRDKRLSISTDMFTVYHSTKGKVQRFSVSVRSRFYHRLWRGFWLLFRQLACVCAAAGVTPSCAVSLSSPPGYGWCALHRSPFQDRLHVGTLHRLRSLA